MKFEDLKNLLESLSYAASIIGIPVAIALYFKDKSNERKTREKESLFTSHSLYVDYLKICLENPDLEIYDLTYKNPEYTKIIKKEFIAFEILFAYLESAFFYYKDQTEIMKIKRWSGWVDFIKGYIKQENFISAWRHTEDQWDKDFSHFMNVLIVEQKAETSIKQE